MRLGVSDVRRYVLVATQLLITLSLLSILIFSFDWNRIGETLASVRLDFLVAAVVCLVAILMFGALNIWILLNGLAQMSFKTILRFYLLSWCTFLLLPGSIGDAIQLFFFKRAGVPFRESGAVYITDKQVTLLLTTLIAGTGGMIYFWPYVQPWTLVGIAALIAIVTITGYTFARKTHHAWILRLLNLLAAPVYFCKIHPWRVATNTVLTLIKLILTGLSHWLTFRATGADVALGLVLTVAIVAGLAAYIPVAFNGVGTVEFTAVTLYGLQDVAAYQVLATYLILRTSVFLLALAGLIVSRFLDSETLTLIQRNNSSDSLLSKLRFRS